MFEVPSETEKHAQSWRAYNHSTVRLVQAESAGNRSQMAADGCQVGKPKSCRGLPANATGDDFLWNISNLRRWEQAASNRPLGIGMTKWMTLDSLLRIEPMVRTISEQPSMIPCAISLAVKVEVVRWWAGTSWVMASSDLWILQLALYEQPRGRLLAGKHVIDGVIHARSRSPNGMVCFLELYICRRGRRLHTGSKGCVYINRTAALFEPIKLLLLTSMVFFRRTCKFYRRKERNAIKSRAKEDKERKL